MNDQSTSTPDAAAARRPRWLVEYTTDGVPEAGDIIPADAVSADKRVLYAFSGSATDVTHDRYENGRWTGSALGIAYSHVATDAEAAALFGPDDGDVRNVRVHGHRYLVQIEVEAASGGYAERRTDAVLARLAAAYPLASRLEWLSTSIQEDGERPPGR